MTVQQQSFINGFVKRAAAHGFSENQAEHMLKQSGIRDVLFKTLGRTGGVVGGAGGAVLGAGLGGIGGGALGAGVGAFEGLTDPGEEKDPVSGEMIEKSIPKAMLAKALRRAQAGALIGGTAGGIGGGGGGAYFGRKGGKLVDSMKTWGPDDVMKKIKEYMPKIEGLDPKDIEAFLKKMQ